jgi:hypothetical protein
MGIAGVEPRQLAPIVGPTGSGSMDSSAPSSTTANLTASTRFDGLSLAMVVDSASPFDIDTNPLTISLDTNVKIDINSAVDTAVGIAMPAIIDTIPSKTEVDIAKSTVIDTTSPSVVDLTPVATIIDTISSPAGAVLVVTGASTWPSNSSTSTWTTTELLS